MGEPLELAIRGGATGSTSAAQFRKAKAAANRAKWERPFEIHIRTLKLPTPVRELRFHPTRLWRLDFAWPEFMFAIEVEGAPGRGRHTKPKGFTDDCIKYNEAALLGWTVYRVTGPQVGKGEAINLLLRVFKAHNIEAGK